MSRLKYKEIALAFFAVINFSLFTKNSVANSSIRLSLLPKKDSFLFRSFNMNITIKSK